MRMVSDFIVQISTPTLNKIQVQVSGRTIAVMGSS